MPDIETPWEWHRELAAERTLPRERRRTTRHTPMSFVIALPRNGLPVPDYVYRGTGADQPAGTYGDTRLDAADDW